jgi:hypothetical protein
MATLRTPFIVALTIVAGTTTTARAADAPPASKAAEAAVTGLRHVVTYVPKNSKLERAPKGPPIFRRLPSDADGIAWATGGGLWVTCIDAGEGEVVRLRGAAEGAEQPPLVRPIPDRDTARVLAPSPNGGRVALGCDDEGLRVLAPDPGADDAVWPVAASGANVGLISRVQWTPRGRIALGVHLVCVVGAIDPRTGRYAWRREEKVARYLGRSPDGHLVLLPWAEGAPAEIVDADTGQTVASRPGPPGGRDYGAVDDDGAYVVMGRDEARITIWNVKKGTASVVALAVEKGVDGLEFLPHSPYVVIASALAVEVLDVRTGRGVARWTMPDGDRLRTYVPASDLAVSPEGTRIAVRCEAGVHVLAVERAAR